MKRNLVSLAILLVCVIVFSLFVAVSNRRADHTPPVITFSDEVPVFSARDPQEVYLQGVTARDDRDGDVTASLVVAGLKLTDADGSIRITYAAFDAAGNVTQAVREAKFSDYESPKFTLDQSLTFAYNTGFDLFRIVNANDALDGDISHRVRITSLEVDSISSVGTHMVELRVSNSLGETVRLVVPVEVYAAGTYGANLTLTDYLIYLPAGQTLDPAAYLDAYSKGSATVSLQAGIPEGYTLEIKNNVQPDVPGVYTVEYRVVQSIGSGENAASYTGYAKLIVVVEG